MRLCRRATEIDPKYSRAWALMSLGQWILRFIHGSKGDDGLQAAQRSLVLDPDLPEAHAVKARILSDTGRDEEAAVELARALELDPLASPLTVARGFNGISAAAAIRSLPSLIGWLWRSPSFARTPYRSSWTPVDLTAPSSCSL